VVSGLLWVAVELLLAAVKHLLFRVAANEEAAQRLRLHAQWLIP